MQEHAIIFDPISFNSKPCSNETDDRDLQRAKQPEPIQVPFRGRTTKLNGKPQKALYSIRFNRESPSNETEVT
jgi:hypothetical protein